MGVAGRRRVTAYYQRHDMLSAYRSLYGAMIRSPDAFFTPPATELVAEAP